MDSEATGEKIVGRKEGGGWEETFCFVKVIHTSVHAVDMCHVHLWDRIYLERTARDNTIIRGSHFTV